MGLSVWAGLTAAMGCAAAGTCASLLKARGAAASAHIDMSRPIRSGRLLLQNRAFVYGLLLATVSVACNTTALSLAPLTLVKPVAASGLVLMAVIGGRILGLKVDSRQRWGLALVAAGLIAVAITAQPGSNNGHGSSLLVFELCALGLGALLVAWHKIRGGQLCLALATGLLVGAGDGLIKHLPHSALTLAVPGILLLALMAGAGILLGAKALQGGSPLAVLAVMAAAANFSSLTGGFTVFGEHLPGTALGLVVYVAAWLAIIGASLLIPRTQP